MPGIPGIAPKPGGIGRSPSPPAAAAPPELAALPAALSLSVEVVDGAVVAAAVLGAFFFDIFIVTPFSIL
jgi:hypothetical protein